jgi:hypothetical protein
MSQNREPPGYLEYAAAMMAKMPYRIMRLQDRGLFYSMRLECWVNGRLPESPGLLAKVLGFDEQEIAESLPAVMHFFSASGGFIFCPELEDYRKHLEEIREKKKAGGRLGATLTNRKKEKVKNRMDKDSAPNPTTNLSSISPSTRQLTRRVNVGSLIQSNPTQSNPNTVSNEEFPKDDFVAAMEAEEARIESSSRVKVRI